MFCLIFLNGASPGTTFPLDPLGPQKIGRDPACDLQLKDESVSRVHAIIECVNGSWRIDDQGSLNHTYVNSRPVDHCVLRSGDLVRVGEFMLVFSRDQAKNAPLKPAHLNDNTRVRRIFGEEKNRIADDPIGADSTSGPIRKLSFLYRLSREMYRVKDVETLCRYALRSSSEVISASAGKASIRGQNGRLRTFVSGEVQPNDESANVLSNWVIERDEAVLIDVNENVSWSSPDDTVERGTVIGVPIPGRKDARGAIEFFQAADESSFDLADLEFVLSVAQQLGMAIEWLEQFRRIENANEQLRGQLKQSAARLLGDCPAIRELRSQLAKVGATDVTTLILGESGTGKEVASNLVHELSGRSSGPFVAVNCAAFSESLLESELFGHEKGAFTGASSRRLGQFERANGGTIFLDEVGEMSPGCQAKLLRLLEGMPFQRLGGSESIQSDVRIVAATNRNLDEMVRQKLFREDLWYRLRVVELHMPPLRERADDVITLANHFLEKLTVEMGVSQRVFSGAAIDQLMSYSWPGNVRELRNAIERAIVLCGDSEIMPNDLGLRGTVADSEASEVQQSLAEVEKQHIEKILQITSGNKSKACEILRIPRTSLYNKLKQYGELTRTK
ncbi:MAG: sigma 54-interacting transcriptional regulator [Planctomycetota bacterium]